MKERVISCILYILSKIPLLYISFSELQYRYTGYNMICSFFAKVQPLWHIREHKCFLEKAEYLIKKKYWFFIFFYFILTIRFIVIDAKMVGSGGTLERLGRPLHWVQQVHGLARKFKTIHSPAESRLRLPPGEGKCLFVIKGTVSQISEI